MYTPRAGRRLLLRSYVFLALSLIGVAFVLNVIFVRSFPDVDPETAVLRETIRELLSREQNSATSFTVTVGAERVTATSLDAGAVAGHGAADAFVPVRDSDDRRFWLVREPAGERVWRIGPIPDQRLQWAALLPALFYLSIFVVLLVWLRPLLRDLDRLTAAAQNFAADSRSPLNTQRDVTELNSLAGNLDAMSARISALLETQAAMTSALSHEIRTPLARMRFALAIEGHVATGDDDRAALIADIEQIDRLVGAMLQYARLDSADDVIDTQRFDAAEWLRCALARQQPRDIVLDTRITPPGLVLTADAGLLDLALSNLVGNALRYAQRRISVSLSATDTDCRLRVEDDGPGIAPAEREQVLDAFRQGGSPASAGSFGLGLAVVRRVAELHGGSVAIESSVALGGCSIVIAWPGPPGPAPVNAASTTQSVDSTATGRA